MGRRRYAECPGRSRLHGAISGSGLTRHRPDRGTSIWIEWHINGDLAKKLALHIKDLNAAVAAIRYVDISCRIHGNAVRHTELTGLVSGLTPGLKPIAVLVHLRYARVNVAVADVGVPCRIPRHVGHLAKHSVHWRQRRFGMLERLRALVRGLLFASEHHQHVALGIELDHHVRTLVRDPDVVFRIDFYRVPERPRVEMVVNLADELAVWAKFEQLRCGSSIGRTSRIAAR